MFKTPALEPPGALTHALAAALCLLAPVEGFLAANQYPALAAEVLPLRLAAVLGGLVVGSLAMLRRERLARVSLWACVFFALAFLYALDTIPRVASVVVASGAAFWILKRNAAMVTMVAAALHVASSLVLHVAASPIAAQRHPGEAIPAEPASRDLPPVVHLVLDEFAGLRGMPAEVPGVGPTVAKLTDYFVRLGFDLHSHAYSQYFETTDSLPNLLNFTSSAVDGAHVAGSGNEFAMRANQYFGLLSRLGYSLSVFQSDYLDYCATPGAPVASCTTYPSNSLVSIADVAIPVAQKSRFIANSLLDSSAFLRKVRYTYLLAGRKLGVALPGWPSGNSRAGPLAVMKTIAELRTALRGLRPGDAYFAHLMLPHYPYILEADCTVKPEIRSWLNTVPFERTGDLVERNDSASRAERYPQYAAQVECTRSIVEDLFAAIRASGQWERAVIIVHGDHGSRIVRHIPRTSGRDLLVDDDFRDAYSTFFAARRGSSPGRLDTAPLPLQTLLAELWQVAAPAAEPHRVYLLPPDQGDLESTPLRGFGPLSRSEDATGRK